MKISLLLLALTPFALAQSQPLQPQLLYASTLTTPAIPYAPINAAGGSFWAGVARPATSTYCPDVVGSACPNVALGLTSFELGGETGTASLNVLVPGGQQVYVNCETGRLEFSRAHSGAPPVAVFEPFVYKSISSGLAEFTLPGSVDAHALACPSDTDGAFEIFSPGYGGAHEGCEDVTMYASPSGAGPAWQYV